MSLQRSARSPTLVAYRGQNARGIKMTCPRTGAAVFTCTPGNGSIKDNAGHQYSIDQAGNAIEDGLPMVAGSGTAKMEFIDGQVYRETANDLWYTWNQVAWSPANAPTMTMTMSMDAGAGGETGAAPKTSAPKTTAPKISAPPVVPPNSLAPNVGGAWSAPHELPISPIAAAITPTGQILTWS